jgi:hypothetical protein
MRESGESEIARLVKSQEGVDRILDVMARYSK